MSGVSVQIDSLSLQLGGSDVLRGLSLEVAPGELLALLGPSGAGKTTLLRAIAGLEKPAAGRILFDGRDMTSVAPRDRNVGFVFQDLGLWPYLTVEEHLAEVTRTPLTFIERFGLGTHEKKRPHQLSGGQRQKLAIARTLAREPKVLLLDEPFTGLDPVLRGEIGGMIAAYRRERELTTIYVSHYYESMIRNARIALLHEGRLEQVATLSELRAEPENDWVVAYVSHEMFQT
ncbi:MAG TPA: ATP-binding cassette domain-containing protein [Planctomycetota bacterium]|jgi:ABC-type Fe3+/spermidine/putrescine transport system ATPase subunit|nr:ATP-binding cassette domain-containing protein [Planctomycetota bacterium]